MLWLIHTDAEFAYTHRTLITIINCVQNVDMTRGNRESKMKIIPIFHIEKKGGHRLFNLPQLLHYICRIVF